MVSAAYSPRILLLGLSWSQVVQVGRYVWPAGSPSGCLHLAILSSFGGMWSAVCKSLLDW